MTDFSNGRLTVNIFVHCHLLPRQLYCIERMSSLQNQLTAIEARLDLLFAAEPRDSALITSLEARAARLGAMILAETPRGVLLVVSSWLQSPICDHVSLILYAAFHCSNNLPINYSLAQTLHLLQDLLCIESYVFMSPFYCSNYQSILFCVGTVIKFLSHNDVYVCLSIVLYLLIPHSYNPHLTSYSYLSFLFHSGSARWGNYDRY